MKAGEKLKESKKKSKMASSTNQTSRDWGRVMQHTNRLFDLNFKSTHSIISNINKCNVMDIYVYEMML